MTVRDLFIKRFHTIEDPTEAARARTLTILLTAMCVILVPFTAIFALVVHPRPEQKWLIAIAVGSIMLMQVASRTAWYRAVVASYVLVNTASIFAGAWFDAGVAPMTSFFFLGPTIFFLSIYFSLPWVLAYSAVATVSALLFCLQIAVPAPLAVAMVLCSFLTTTFAVCATIIRKVDEQRIRDEERATRLAQRDAVGKTLRWEAMLKTAPLGLFQTDENGKLVFANGQLLHWLDLSADNLPHDVSEIIDGPDVPEFKEMFTSYRTGATDRFRVEIHLKSENAKAGRRVVVRMTRQKSPDGEFLGYFGSIEDVTELRDATEKAVTSARLATLGEMSANVAHELNNPLTVLLTNSEILEGELGQSSERAHVAFGAVKQAAETVRTIADGLRGVARSGVEKSVVDAIKVLRRTEKFFASVLRRDGVELVTECGNDSVWVRADSGKIQQILINLLSNARDAIRGQGTKKIKLALTEDKGVVRFLVADNGPGIPPEHRDKVLKSGFTTKSEGTGLGLPICNRIAREHGGSLMFTTEMGVGTTFSLTLPTVAAPTAQAVPHSGRVLVVDDEPDLRQAMSFHLDGMGFRVDEAENGKAALDRLDEGDYDFVFSDVSMPGLAGEELFKKILSHPRFKGSLFVVSGHLAGDGDLEGFSARVKIAGFIPKPYTREDIERALASSRATKRAA